MNVGTVGSSPVPPQVVASKAAAAKLVAAAAAGRRKKAHAKAASPSVPSTSAASTDLTKPGFSVRA